MVSFIIATLTCTEQLHGSGERGRGRGRGVEGRGGGESGWAEGEEADSDGGAPRGPLSPARAWSETVDLGLSL